MGSRTKKENILKHSNSWTESVHIVVPSVYGRKYLCHLMWSTH